MFLLLLRLSCRALHAASPSRNPAPRADHNQQKVRRCVRRVLTTLSRSKDGAIVKKAWAFSSKWIAAKSPWGQHMAPSRAVAAPWALWSHPTAEERVALRSSPLVV